VGQGSGRSFEEFFAASYGRLVGVLFAFLHDRAQAEDAVQDAFASALLRWPVLRGYHNPEAVDWPPGRGGPPSVDWPASGSSA
jgi:predicted RNA polymerase sigma factor